MTHQLSRLDSGDAATQRLRRYALWLLVVLLLLALPTGSTTADEESDLAARAQRLTYEGFDHLDAGRYPDAYACFREVLEIQRRLLPGDHTDVALTLGQVGSCLMKLGRPENALAFFEQGWHMHRRLHDGDHPDVALSTSSVAFCLQSQGRGREALPLHRQALAMARRLHPGDHPEVARGLGNLASCLKGVGLAPEALPFFKQALAMYMRLYEGDHADVALALNNLAACLQAVGQGKDALPLYARALAMRKRLHGSISPEVAAATTSLATCLGLINHLEEALPLLEHALRLNRRIFAGDHPEVARSLNNLAGCHTDMGRPEKALPLLDEALEMTRRLLPGDHVLVARALHNMATCLQRLERTEEALPLMIEALEMGRRLDDPERYLYAGNLAMLLFEDVVRSPEAVELFEEAIAEIEALRADARDLGHTDRSAFYGHLRRFDPYHAMAHLQVRLGQSDEALTYLERGRARALLDLLAGRAGGDVVDLAQPAAAAGIRAALRPGERLLVYSVGTQNSQLLVVGPPGVTMRAEVLWWPDVFRAVTTETLTTATDAYLAGLETRADVVRGRLRKPDAEKLTEIHELGEFLFRTLLPDTVWQEVRRAPRVYVVPHGPLHRLPFEALVVDADVEGRLRYVLDEAPPIAYAPSGSVLLWCRARRDEQRSRMRAPVVVALGEPVYGSGHTAASSEVLKPLPGTRKEVEAIERAFASPPEGVTALPVETLLREEATEQRLYRRAPLARYLHVGTHGLVDERDDAGRFALALTCPSIATPANDGLLTLLDLFDRWRDRLDGCELAVLSACRTQHGPLQRDEGVFALSWGLHYAGCPSVVASLWDVSDASTAELMGDFYGRLAKDPDGDKLGTLNAARKELRKKHPEPFFWAPFIYVGDPR